MPHIVVQTETPDGLVTWRERVTPADFETEHGRLQLADRLRWAVQDARAAEAAGDPPPELERRFAPLVEA